MDSGAERTCGGGDRVQDALPVLSILGAGTMGRLVASYARSSNRWGAVHLYDRSMVTADPYAPFRNGDVVVEFAAPDATSVFVSCLERHPKPYILGTTGCDHETLGRLRAVGDRCPILIAPNLSPMVAFMTSFVRQMARSFGDPVDVEISECHHRLKKDAPSGTALQLADGIAAEKGWDRSAYCYDRSHHDRPRLDREIGFAVSRGGNIFGHHRVAFMGLDEVLTFSHDALNRDIFAKGALRAAQWIVAQGPGLYTMNDVLGLPPL